MDSLQLLPPKFLASGHKDQPRGQALLGLVLVLCLLIALVPKLSESPQSLSSKPVSVSALQNYALLPVAVRIGGELHRIRNNGDIYQKMLSIVSALVASFCAHKYLAPSLGAISSLISLNRPHQKGYRQACQLLDLPPPSV